MIATIHITRITTDLCLPLRREVLWPGLTEEECRVPQDLKPCIWVRFRGSVWWDVFPFAP